MSNDYAKHQILRERGIDVLVIDHHHAERVSEDACIINNQLCDYPNKTLSGVGMVYKFCARMDELLGTKYADNYLDLVALGMVADVMDLRDFETRRLITKGLKNINNPFFEGMTIKNDFSLKGKITPFGVAFYIAPYINAVTRCGTQEEKMLLFESMLEYKAYRMVLSTKKGCKGQTEPLVEQAVRTCTNIKNRQTKSRDYALGMVETIIQERGLLDDAIIVITLDKNHAIDKALTGLVANQIANKYQTPTLILSETKIEGIPAWAGSGRNCGRNELTDFRQFLLDSGFALEVAGHSSAFGFSIAQERFDDFMLYVNIKLRRYNFNQEYLIDFEYDANNLPEADILNMADFDWLWGQGVEEPYVLVKNIKITSDKIQLLKGSTIKINLPNKINMIKFKSSEEEFNHLNSETGYVIINVVGRFQKNEWNGYINPQILIEDFEIVGGIKYYF